jgi:nicotinamide N-methyltransferase
MSELEEDTVYLFQDPEGWNPAEKQPTFAEHVLHSGEKLNLRLVGHSPLWVRI